MAHVTGNGVRVTSAQLPEIWAKVVEASKRLGLARTPEVYVIQHGGVLNAFATKLLSRRFVIIYSELLDACEAAGDREAGRPSELDFVIGHELGHLAAGHLAWQWFLLPSRLVPLLGPAYSRAREYTCDLCGLTAIDDLEVSSRALAILAAGGHAGRRVNLDMFVEQVTDTGRFWMAVFELNASHPFLSKRVAALRAAKGLSTAPAAPRNILAYPLAPILGMGGGGPVALVVIITYALVITQIPALSKYLGKKKAAGEASQTYEPPPSDDQPAQPPR
jgi:Zn-dependent protease with chaperone function